MREIADSYNYGKPSKIAFKCSFMEIESPTMLRESTNLGSKEETQRHISATCCRILYEVYASSLTLGKITRAVVKEESIEIIT
jgi:hypothetical protein